ncbi:MAG: HlyC/CorC family transporter [Minwuiales bacterium]|nr:HlyC/CorC family transporter [Minwuiales bacterium]
MLFSLLAIFVLLLLSAVFSGSETALTAASRARMHLLEQEGDRRAAIVNRLSQSKARLIGGILLGNNLVNILASALATSVLISVLGDAGVAVATLIMTLLVLIFAEVLPKTYALHNPDRMALAVAPVIRPVISVFSPITSTIQAIVRGTLHMVGVDIHAAQNVDATGEIRGAIQLHTQEGAMVKADRDMLDSILELDEVQVAEVMIHRSNMALIDAGEPPEAVVAQVLDSPYTRIPIWKGEPENIIGILHSKDLLRALSAAQGAPENIDIAAIAATPWFVPETTTLREQLNAFRERHAHFALVVDEYGALMGLVTLEDILEEIVGEISDEHDVTVTGVEAQADGTFIVDGAVTIRDLNRQFDWDLPDEEATTVAGLVIHEARVIPEVSQVFSFHGYKFEILGRRKNRISALRITAPQVTEEEEKA